MMLVLCPWGGGAPGPHSLQLNFMTALRSKIILSTLGLATEYIDKNYILMAMPGHGKGICTGQHALCR
jgi:hypothetical protein